MATNARPEVRALAARLVLASALLCGCSNAPDASRFTASVPPSPPTGLPSAAASPPPSPTALPSPSATAVAASALPETSWHVAYDRDGARMGSLIAGPAGFLASGCLVGEGGDCEQVIVVASPDGERWTLTVVDPNADLFAPSLRVVNGRIFALGYGHYGEDGGARVWTSTDGRAWAKVEAASFRGRSVDDIIDSPFGTFATGYEAPIDSDNTSGFVVWRVDVDGSFGEARSIDLGEDQKLLSGAAWTGDEFLAWASPRWVVGETTLLHSRDAANWKVRSTIATPPESYASQIMPSGDRLLAVGSSGGAFPLVPRAWVSDDGGKTWRVASVEGTDGRMFSVAVDAGRLVARGVAPSLDGDAASWTSSDGSVWTRLPDDEDVPAIARFTSSSPASIGTLACVVGTFEGAGGPRGAIYCAVRT
jgi:hypothetical protein